MGSVARQQKGGDGETCWSCGSNRETQRQMQERVCCGGDWLQGGGASAEVNALSRPSCRTAALGVVIGRVRGCRGENRQHVRPVEPEDGHRRQPLTVRVHATADRQSTHPVGLTCSTVASPRTPAAAQVE